MIIAIYSTLFAEAFPARWDKKGIARRLIGVVWKFGAMFLVLSYLCNLRSHLIKPITVKPPESIKELVSSKYSYKILILPAFANFPALQTMDNPGRLVKHLKSKKC